MEDLNDYKPPTLTIDESLSDYRYQNHFAKKLQEANALLEKVGLPLDFEDDIETSTKIALFQEKQIRRVWRDKVWWFSVVDVIQVLANTKDPSDYWTTLKRREKQLPTVCRKFKFTAADGKQRPTDCANTKGILRIVMSIPASKAEPFKLWLAQIGQERIEEIENPELGFERLKDIYKAKGYPNEWVENYVKTINIQQQLVDELENWKLKKEQEYGILTAEIDKATFGSLLSEKSKSR